MYSTRCAQCKHYKGEFKCKAFPDRIPKEIFLGSHMHTRPLEGQPNDITYEPAFPKPTTK